MASHLLQGVGSAVGWRTHQVLEETEELQSPLPDRFRKRPSSSSLNTLRMSLRKKLPLKTVDVNLQEEITWETLENRKKVGTVCSISRSAKNALGSVSQKLQKRRHAKEECLVGTPGKSRCGENHPGDTPVSTPCRPTPSRVSPTVKRTTKRTPKSGVKRTPRVKTPENNGCSKTGRVGNYRRKLVRMAAVKSPFASPGTHVGRRQFNKDLEFVSAGLSQLKGISHVFEEAIGRDECNQAIENYKQLMINSYTCSHNRRTRRISQASIRQAARIQNAFLHWADVTLSSIGKKS
ncbi:protein PIMREG-like isoform X1 [Polypterus senegalus]|uniref:protein PIMREG-like isoform X1 n=1 Tax=Polypterus senegalus TaxID=55291 RepID=UPI00196553FB|nr:protein PIMREG-like isoform X1 [Polypterus senegalus]XP_039613165.1 protein PIMREG-like isoform X1 [Polypterus senegalus]